MNIIQIRNTDIRQADVAFKEFMGLTENYLNEKTTADFNLYKKCKGTELEKVALDALHEVSPSTAFRKENIRLVSGAKFPDIVAEQFYGVEVKSTQEDSWKSTGSSIVESTRVKDVANIYLLFGKLGGKRAEFKCLPYQDCLSNIAITHSPRYLIDMELCENKSQTIFDKIEMGYDEFRMLDEHEKFAIVRQYYKERAKQQGKIQMPWWMGDDSVTEPVLSLYSDLSRSDKQKMVAKMFILFPADVLKSDFKRPALWMCNRYSIINPNMRDHFSAGGKITSLGSIELPVPMPRILGRLYHSKEWIKILFANPDIRLEADMKFYWDDYDESKSYMEQWMEKVLTIFNKHPKLKKIGKELFLQIME